MADVEALIWHDAQGKIVAVGHAIAGATESIQPLAQPHRKIVKLLLPEEHLDSLHLTHSVDVERGTLRARKESEGSPASG